MIPLAIRWAFKTMITGQYALFASQADPSSDARHSTSKLGKREVSFGEWLSEIKEWNKEWRDYIYPTSLISGNLITGYGRFETTEKPKMFC
jgi:hypothetical protein